MSGILSRTDLGPLTTTFTPPSSCFTPNLDIDTDTDSVYVFPEYGKTCSFGESTYDSNCFPHDFDNLYQYEALSSYHAVYSPASICPSGFRSACAFTRTEGPIEAPYSAERAILSVLTPGEVDIACCRIGYTCGFEDHIMSCDSQAEDGDVVTGKIYDDDCKAKTATITVDASETVVFDYMVPIHIAMNPDSTSSATATSTQDSDADDKPSSGTNTTVIIVVVVVVVLVSVILALAAFIIWRRRKAKKAAMPSAGNEHYQEIPGKSPYGFGYNSNNNNNVAHELSTADTFARVPELPTAQTQFIHELPAEEFPAKSAAFLADNKQRP